MAERVAQFWQNVQRATQAGKEAAIQEGVTVLYQATLDELAKGSPGKGRNYKRGRKIHQASKRGAAPARDTGNLIQSIGFVLERGEQPKGVVGVKHSAPYAKYLDPPIGHREPHIGRRPFLSSAFTKNEQRIKDAMRDELERHLRRLAR